MNALDVVSNIVTNDCLLKTPLKYCLVDEHKIPYRVDGTNARPNNKEDFVDISEILNVPNLEEYKSLGISIQASNICAVDVDHCFKKPFVLEDADERAIEIINLFKDVAYIEFSFSGTGLRILFKSKIVENYDLKYYTKNSSKGIEFYSPERSNRYVTITGRVINNNGVDFIDQQILLNFLEKYMIRNTVLNNIEPVQNVKDERDLSLLLKIIRRCYLKNFKFQDNWFNKAPGYGHNESERDFYLVSYIYENVTKDPEKIRLLFEESDFFKTKDYMHLSKWKKNEYKYFNTIYDKIRQGGN